MNYQLAQLNLAQFCLPMEHPTNADFVNNLDQVNAIAESQPGFVWRYLGGEDLLEEGEFFGNPNIIVNLSVWEGIDSLTEFAYRNDIHRSIMQRRREWFERMEFYLVLWWVKEGHTPDVSEARDKLHHLQKHGPSADAFNFRHAYPAPSLAG